jgi:hypothetical protein
MPHAIKDQEIAMLRAELELLMKERQALLQVAGAATGFIAELDSFDVPRAAMEAAELLAERVNALPEETLQDASTRSRRTAWPEPFLRPARTARHPSSPFTPPRFYNRSRFATSRRNG